MLSVTIFIFSLGLIYIFRNSMIQFDSDSQNVKNKIYYKLQYSAFDVFSNILFIYELLFFILGSMSIL